MEPLVSTDDTHDEPVPESLPPSRYRLPGYRRFRVDPFAEVAADDPSYYVPTPEDFLPSPPKPESPLVKLPSLAAGRTALLGFVLFWATSLHDWRGLGQADFAVTHDQIFKQHEYWRLLTALFDHADVGHIAANAPLFLIFGWYLRAFFGWLAFPFGALLVGVLSNLATVAGYGPESQLLGASGMIYGMVSLWLLFYVRYETTYSPRMRLFRATAVSLLLLFPTTFEKNVSYLAHAWGFFIGIGVGLALLPFVRLRRSDDRPPPGAQAGEVAVAEAAPRPVQVVEMPPEQHVFWESL